MGNFGRYIGQRGVSPYVGTYVQPAKSSALRAAAATLAPDGGL